MLNRLIGIIYLVMSRGTVTAVELAQRYEVSARTIYRDVEKLSMAGIPIYTKKGKNGGISLTEQFVLDKMLVTEKEQRQILSALTSMSETGAMDEKEIVRKLGDFFRQEPSNWVAIDLSDWSGRRKEVFEGIRQAILEHRVLEFDYYGQYGEMRHRSTEPLQLLFKEYTWYLKAYCRDRKAMRMFKVFRMKRVQLTEEEFCQDAGRYLEYEEPADNPADKRADITVVLRIDASEAYRIYDRFEEDEIAEEDGGFLIRMNCMVDDWVYGLILSFGPSAEVLEPVWMRSEVEQRLRQMINKYT